MIFLVSLFRHTFAEKSVFGTLFFLEEKSIEICGFRRIAVFFMSPTKFIVVLFWCNCCFSAFAVLLRCVCVRLFVEIETILSVQYSSFLIKYVSIGVYIKEFRTVVYVFRDNTSGGK